MELLFRAILLLLMAWALGSGYPVAFALPGASIITIGLAAGAGYLFGGGTDDRDCADDLSGADSGLRIIRMMRVLARPSRSNVMSMPILRSFSAVGVSSVMDCVVPPAGSTPAV